MFIRPGGILRVGYAFGGPYYYRDEFATGLLQSIYVHDHRLREHIPSDGIIVDSGANIGPVCTFAQHFLRASNIISVEPLAEPFTALQLNNKHLSFPFAVGAQNGNAELYIDDRDIFASLVASPNSDSRRVEKRVVEVRRLDDLDAIVGLKYIDLLKIDTEGSEYDVIKTKPLVIKKTYCIMIECSINHTGVGSITQVIIHLAEAHPHFHVIDIINCFVRNRRLECIDVLWENRKLLKK